MAMVGKAGMPSESLPSGWCSGAVACKSIYFGNCPMNDSGSAAR